MLFYTRFCRPGLQTIDNGVVSRNLFRPSLSGDLKEVAHAGLPKKKKFGVNFYRFRYDFSVAFISALAFLKYASLRLSVVV